jgi:hypothetical protein
MAPTGILMGSHRELHGGYTIFEEIIAYGDLTDAFKTIRRTTYKSQGDY